MEYRELVELYEKLNKTSKRLEMTYYLSEFIKKADDKDLSRILLLVQGKIFPDWQETKIGMSSKLVIKAISKATGMNEKTIVEEWKKLGDLGDVAEQLIKKRKQSSLFPRKLSVAEVFENLQKLSTMEGKGSVEKKLSLVSEMLIASKPEEAKYIVRTVLDKLRIGIGSGSIRDALVWAFFSDKLNLKYNKEKNDIELDKETRKKYNELLDKVQHAYDLTNDFGKVAIKLKESGENITDELSIEIGKPIQVMLFQKVNSVEEAFEVVGKPAAFEPKYDGFRVQVHIKGKEIKIFTRRLENITKQFPDIVENLKKSVDVDSCILDGEAIGYNPETFHYLPFQKISQRIKRKYNIEEMARNFPVEVNFFDIIYHNGKSLIHVPFKERRSILEKIIKQERRKIVLAEQLITSDLEEAKNFYNKCLKIGEEGMMAKNLNSEYKPGKRVGYGVKIKSIMEPLDLVIIAADYGEGKRSGWLTSFYLACKDNEKLKEIGKVSTGFKELETQEGITFEEMTNILEPLIIKTQGKHVKVKPKIVVEVGYEEIQKSTTYSSGFALRFPRFLRLRTEEKTVNDINTLEDVKKLYEIQRGRNK